MYDINIGLHHRELHRLLLPRLIGQVFHVTTEQALSAILVSGAIKSNADESFRFTFGQSKASFFRKRGYISVFDLRSATAEQIDEALGKYYFLNPSFTNNEPVYLFLAESCFESLIPWIRWKEEKSWQDMVVPYVEAGHPSPLSTNLIEGVLHVKIENPLSPFVEALRQGLDIQELKRKRSR